MTNTMIMAGFGGQGVLLIGQIVTYAGMLEGKQVTWIPAYGPEMRGGTANCSVTVSDEPIGAPIVTEPDTVVAMNLPSLDKFEPMMQPGGILIINSSLIEREAKRKDIKAYRIPANDLANELGNAKVANMVILGAILAATGVVTTESLSQAFKKMFAKKFANKPHLFEINEKAVRMGAEYVEKQK